MINIIYWSGTGNTEQMAHSIEDGIKSAGKECKVIEVSSASIEDVTGAEKIAFGCPAMGAEELEESTMRPFMDEANKHLSGKKIALFGSYEWADGQWIKDWKDEVEDFGAILVDEPLAVYDKPTDDDKRDCESLGKLLANS